MGRHSSSVRSSLLLLLRSGGQRSHRQRGYAMAVVMLVLLAAAVSAGSLALRGGSGQAAGNQLSASRQARDAAEAGITATIGELNKPENRRLLVSGAAPNTWGSSTDPFQQNPCGTDPPLPSLSASGANNWKQIGANRFYVLRSIRHANRTRSDRLTWSYATAGSGSTPTKTETTPPYNNNGTPRNEDVNLNPAARAGEENYGFIQLVVEGRIVRPGGNPLTSSDRIASATVTKEYEVIPKCCNRSFSGPELDDGTRNSFGNDQRLCPGGTSAGLVFGFNNGSLNISGSGDGLRVIDDAGQIINARPPAILCVVQSADPSAFNHCQPSPLTLGTGRIQVQIPVLPTFIEAPPPAILPSLASLPATSAGIIPTPGFSVPSGDIYYYRVKTSGSGTSSGAIMEVCRGSVDSSSEISVIPGSCQNLNYCRESNRGVTNATSPNINIDCRMSKIEASGGEQMYIDTSRGSISMFFNEPPGSPDNNRIGDIRLTGTSRLLHQFCSTPPASNRGCNLAPPARLFTRLALYGSGSNSEVVFNGGSQTTSMALDFRQGSVEIAGNTTIIGNIWSNNLDLRGNFTSATDPSSCTNNLNGFCFVLGRTGGIGAGATAPFFDWIARTPVTTKAY